jgi:hypothetical protein
MQNLFYIGNMKNLIFTQMWRDFVRMFCWMVTCEAIFGDFGIITGKTIWYKYSMAACAGLFNALYAGPLQRKRKKALATE